MTTYVLVILLIAKGELLARSAVLPSLDACQTVAAKLYEVVPKITTMCVELNDDEML